MPMEPITWKLSHSYLKLEISDLQNNFKKLMNESKKLFSDQFNTIKVHIITYDGEEESDLDNFGKVFEERSNHIAQVKINAYIQKKTPGMGLPIPPSEFAFVGIDLDRRKFNFEVSILSSENAKSVLEILTKNFQLINVDLPKYHRYIETYLKKFYHDHPIFERNVFLIMRFKDESPFPEIVDSIKKVCQENGLELLRADDKEYTNDLWDNVLTYLYGCGSAIAVFDQINSRDFNPNIALEVGFLLSQGKPVLLLKDKAIEVMPTDIVGKIYREFNTYSSKQTVPPQVTKWIADYHLDNWEKTSGEEYNKR